MALFSFVRAWQNQASPAPPASRPLPERPEQAGRGSLVGDAFYQHWRSRCVWDEVCTRLNALREAERDAERLLWKSKQQDGSGIDPQELAKASASLPQLGAQIGRLEEECLHKGDDVNNNEEQLLRHWSDYQAACRELSAVLTEERRVALVRAITQLIGGIPRGAADYPSDPSVPLPR